MLVFPQLVTGVVALYPVTKRLAARTVVNTLEDGHTVVFADPDAEGAAWELKASGLTRVEWDAIESLFQATSGRWQTFTFLDPTANLLSKSEEFGASAWTNGALLQLTPGIDDPFGTTRATRVINAGQAAEAVAQTLSVPDNFQYCLSVWARTIGGSSVTLIAGGATKKLSLTTQWARLFLTGSQGQTFGVQLDAGGSVDLFGMQVEAQLAPSDYKETGASGGVHRKARFAEDRIAVKAQATDMYDAVVRIVNTES